MWCVLRTLLSVHCKPFTDLPFSPIRDPHIIRPTREKSKTLEIQVLVPMSDSKILIADDNPTNVELLEAYLSDVDCQIEVAVDGRDALEKVDRFKPDLILLDIMMPGLSGFEVCEKLKDDPATSHIMVLMVTALNELGDIERAVAAGCDDFLSKPVNKLELLKRVENMLKLRHVTDQLRRLRDYIDGIEDSSGPKP
jgi:two-component system alkaline phosphatase synthesis response regulator PhoP